MNLTIDMPWQKDLSVNHCRMGPKGNWRLKDHVQAWMDMLAWKIKIDLMQTAQHMMWLPGDSPINVVVDFRYPNDQKRDDHNTYKILCDAVAAGLGIDDKHIRISTGTIEIDRDNPGFMITVEDSK